MPWYPKGFCRQSSLQNHFWEGKILRWIPPHIFQYLLNAKIGWFASAPAKKWPGKKPSGDPKYSEESTIYSWFAQLYTSICRGFWTAQNLHFWWQKKPMRPGVPRKCIRTKPPKKQNTMLPKNIYIYSHCLVISDIYVLSYTIGYKII